jgi:hypothetical protein
MGKEVTRWAEIRCKAPKPENGIMIRRVTELERREDNSIPLESSEVGCTSANIQACQEVRDGTFQLVDRVFCRDSGKRCSCLTPEVIKEYLDTTAKESDKNIP